MSVVVGELKSALPICINHGLISLHLCLCCRLIQNKCQPEPQISAEWERARVLLNRGNAPTLSEVGNESKRATCGQLASCVNARRACIMFTAAGKPLFLFFHVWHSPPVLRCSCHSFDGATPVYEAIR